MVVLKELGRFKPFFTSWNCSGLLENRTAANRHMASAMVKVRVGDGYEITADEGDGAVHALDRALRKALEVFYPALSGVQADRLQGARDGYRTRDCSACTGTD
ncbi:MAG: alpha-isopropylmalate synthase regulatory domain-containing protein [Oscillospiraceae bacterium]